MSYYLKSKRLDIRTSDALIFVLHEDTAREHGLIPGSRVHVCWKDICVYGTIDTSNTLVGYEEIGLYEDVWFKYGIPSNDVVFVDVVSNTSAIEAIKKKLLGGTLDYDEIHDIMVGIANRSLSTIEITYFAATSYSPGFTEQEVYYMTKAMAETGERLNFSYLKKKVVDKHSIGGIPAKGITPVMVAILACFDLIIPNTSSRAITTPAGTSDVLEVLFPVTLSKDGIMKTVEKTNACLVWGGGVDLAPADDVLINIQRPLHIESYEQFIISIIAKKIATGIQYFLVDLPVGEGTKIHDEADIPLVASQFKKLGKLFNISVDVYERRPMGPDGNGIGPILEARDILYIFERHPRRPQKIENVAIDMAGKILEMTGLVPAGMGYNLAKAKLEDGSAEKKFWEIAFAQGGNKKTHSSSLVLADFSHEILSPKSGKISRISSKQVVKVCQILGAPFIKQAGIYFDKLDDQTIAQGERLMTIYSPSRRRIDLAKKYIEDHPEIVVID
ncbi:MAG TPA: thymidine phosphorylase [Candidatus Dojkabacteria bacterium]|nr:thymidine phosphorylase [Candidatus Dojkabacteria bacterium]